MLYVLLWGECSFLLEILPYSRTLPESSPTCWQLDHLETILRAVVMFSNSAWRAEEKAASTTDCRDGWGSGDAAPYQSPAMCAVMSVQETASDRDGVQLESTGKLQAVGNYTWIANEMLFYRSYKPIFFLRDNSSFFLSLSPNYCAPALTSTQSEKAIQADQTGTLQFQADYWQYEINFKGEVSVCLMSNAGGMWLVLQHSISCMGKACRPGHKSSEKLFTDFNRAVLQ